MAPSGDPAAQWQRGLAFLSDDELGPHQGPVRRCGAVDCDGQGHYHAAIARQEVSLPGAPHHRVATAEQIAVAGVLACRRIVAGRRIVEVLHRPLVAAVAIVEEEPPVAAGRIDRFQDAEIGGELDQAIAIAQRLVHVDDASLRRRVGINGKPGPPDQPLVSAGLGESVGRRPKGPSVRGCRSQFCLLTPCS